MKTISRQQAKASGLTRYYTGLVCINGHTMERNVSTCACIGCTTMASDKYRAKESSMAKAKAYRIKHKAKLAKRSRDWYHDNKAKSDGVKLK